MGGMGGQGPNMGGGPGPQQQRPPSNMGNPVGPPGGGVRPMGGVPPGGQQAHAGMQPQARPPGPGNPLGGPGTGNLFGNNGAGPLGAGGAPQK